MIARNIWIGYIRRLSFYSPWYNLKNQVMGIFGSTIVLGLQSLEQSLKHIKELGFLNASWLHSLPSNNFIKDNFYDFTKRQVDCIHVLSQGKSLRETASILNLSVRTVEGYFEQIKRKMNVKSKSEFMGKILNPK